MTDFSNAPPAIASAQELRRRTLELLEFPRLLQAVAFHAHLPISRELALSLAPAYDPETVRRRQQETAEARLLLDEAGDVDLSTERDVRPLLQRAALNGTLTGDELLAIADALELVRRAKAVGTRLQGRAPLLRAMARNIPDLRTLERELRRKINPSGELADDATPYLRQLRHESREAYRLATEAMERVMESVLTHEVLQERYITVRGDRLVVPVKAEQRHRLPGVVHGVSDSGATLFIEPLSNVQLCNTWREWAAAEAEESQRVLGQLSMAVGQRVRQIQEALELAGRLDLALAKARYASSSGATAVHLLEAGEPELHLVEARHPLLPDPVVPISLALKPPALRLVITGPNTGGKTVALKTVGLLVLMHQAGLHIPAEAASRLPVFDGVYADIGDQQSVQESVSSFSSHMGTIAGILASATSHSLVLLDELGTSTDPEEGSALARAILAYLADRGMATVVTTHHRTVAIFADEHPALENASVELDPVTLKPTYRLTMGLPGRSYAMAVAERLGLDPQVVEAARELQDPSYRATEGLLESLQEERYHTRVHLQEAEERRAQAMVLQEELERRLAELAQAQDRVVEETRQELLAEAREVMAALRRVEAAAAWESPPPRVTQEARQEVADLQRRLRSRLWGRPSAAPPGRRSALTTGDLVEIGALGFTGTVSAPPDRDRRVEVLVGNARVVLRASQLRKVGVAPDRSTGLGAGRALSTIRLNPEHPVLGPEPELDLRGLRSQDALERLDAFLDLALVQGREQARIIHGKGTGALRQAIWKHLTHHPAVQRYDFATAERGGDGATVVELG